MMLVHPRFRALLDVIVGSPGLHVLFVMASSAILAFIGALVLYGASALNELLMFRGFLPGLGAAGKGIWVFIELFAVMAVLISTLFARQIYLDRHLSAAELPA
jgi:hypothetical protein